MLSVHALDRVGANLLEILRRARREIVQLKPREPLGLPCEGPRRLGTHFIRPVPHRVDFARRSVQPGNRLWLHLQPQSASDRNSMRGIAHFRWFSRSISITAGWAQQACCFIVSRPGAVSPAPGPAARRSCGAPFRPRHDPLGRPRGRLEPFRGCARRPRRRTCGGAAPGARAPPARQLIHGRTELGGRLPRANAGRLERRVLVRRGALATRDDGPGVPHALARGSGDAGDIGDHGLGTDPADVMRGGFLVAATDFTHENNALGARIALKELQHIDEVHAAHRVTADADAGALAEPDVGGLEYGLVGERARARHDADAALLVNEARHDADLAFLRRDDARAVGADQARSGAGQHRLHAHHVIHRDAFGDAHRQLDARIDGLQNRIRRPGRRPVDHAGRGAGRAHRVPHRVEYRQSQVLLSAAARSHAAHEPGAVGQRCFRVKGALLAGKSLADHPGVAVDQNAHAPPFAASPTPLRAASARSAAAVIASPLLASFARASCALVPSSRTTTGTLTPTFFTALITPSAMVSQRTMPPKMFTSTARTRELDRISSNAAVTRSLVAPPPTSRKFPGRPWCSLIRSMVAIASPAPFTMQAMSPSRDT